MPIYLYSTAFFGYQRRLCWINEATIALPMHKIQLVCPNYKELGKDRGKISEFLPWRDMEETPSKFPEEYPCYWSLFLFRVFCWKEDENMYPELHHLHADLSPCLAPVQSVWETSPLQTNHPAGIILPEKLSVEGSNEATCTQIERCFFKAALCCQSSFWRAKGQPPHMLGGNGQLSSCVFDSTNTHCGTDRCSHLVSGLKQLDLVSGMGAKPHSSPSVLRKSMLVGGSHMLRCAELSCSIICVETKHHTSLLWNKPGSTNHRSTANSPTVIQVSVFMSDNVWGFEYLWRQKPNIVLCRQKQMH